MHVNFAIFRQDAIDFFISSVFSASAQRSREQVHLNSTPADRKPSPLLRDTNATTLRFR